MSNEETPFMRRYREEVGRRNAGTQQVTGICPACGDLLVKSLNGTKHSRAANTCPGLVRSYQ